MGVSLYSYHSYIVPLNHLCYYVTNETELVLQHMVPWYGLSTHNCIPCLYPIYYRIDDNVILADLTPFLNIDEYHMVKN